MTQLNNRNMWVNIRRKEFASLCLWMKRLKHISGKPIHWTAQENLGYGKWLLLETCLMMMTGGMERYWTQLYIQKLILQAVTIRMYIVHLLHILVMMLLSILFDTSTTPKWLKFIGCSGEIEWLGTFYQLIFGIFTCIYTKIQFFEDIYNNLSFTRISLYT